MEYYKECFINNKSVEEEKNHKIEERELLENAEKILNNRHDTHIVKMYFEKNNFIMDLDKKVWGQARIVFINASVKYNNTREKTNTMNNEEIQNEYWLFYKIHKTFNNLKIDISLSKYDISILCNDIYVKVEEKEYFNKLYESCTINLYEEIYDDKEGIANAVLDKEINCGKKKLTTWEQLLFSFVQIYEHFSSYRYRNIDTLMGMNYYNYSLKEQEKIYIQLFKNLEKNIIESVQILEEYQDIINEKELKEIIIELLTIYNKEKIKIADKNKLYLQLTYDMNIDFNRIYKRILDCIYEGLIK